MLDLLAQAALTLEQGRKQKARYLRPGPPGDSEAVRQELLLRGPTRIKAAVKEGLMVDLCLGTRREDGLGLTSLRRGRKNSLIGRHGSCRPLESRMNLMFENN